MKSFSTSSLIAALSTTFALCMTTPSFAASAVAYAVTKNPSSSIASSASVTLNNLNRAVVSKLHQEMLSNVDINSLGRYFSENLIQHDPKIADGKAAMLNSIQAQRLITPALGLTVKHIIADKDLVFVQSHLSNTLNDEFSGVNRYDFYRLDRGLIVEHWALQSKAAKTSKSGNSSFNDAYVYSTPPTPLTEQRVEMNRLLTVSLSEDVFSRRDFGLLDRMWSFSYFQHNPGIINGRDALKGVIEYIAPVGNIYRVVRSLADGDLSIVCAQGQDPGSDPKNEFDPNSWEVCDMYRVVNYELVEHWDIFASVPATTLNGHSRFSNLYRAPR
jgi:predicted SnoaL-like aldol condensation-catalyzing enzyme